MTLHESRSNFCSAGNGSSPSDWLKLQRWLLDFCSELVNAVEQVIFEEFYEIEIQLLFKWRAPPPKPLKMPAVEGAKTEEEVEA